MLVDFFATKLGMTQAWTKDGKRLAITRCKATPNTITSSQTVSVLDKTVQGRAFQEVTILGVGSGKKKLKNMPKPLRSSLEKSGFSQGVARITGVRVPAGQETPALGSSVTAGDVLEVGDVVQVQGTTKGRGFAGAVKRYGFHGGPKTHGQSDRTRAVGSIGAGTTPGRVWKGKRMPGHYGTDTQTVPGLIVVHLDPVAQEIWLSGPVPGSITSSVRIRKTGKKKAIELDATASQLVMPVAEVTTEVAPEITPEVSE